VIKQGKKRTQKNLQICGKENKKKFSGIDYLSFFCIDNYSILFHSFFRRDPRIEPIIIAIMKALSFFCNEIDLKTFLCFFHYSTT